MQIHRKTLEIPLHNKENSINSLHDEQLNFDLEDQNNTEENVSDKVCTSRDKSLIMDENKQENNTHYWPKETCLIAEDSVVEGIDERKMSSKQLFKVRKFPGAATSDLKPLIEKKSDHVILHVGTNDAVNYEETKIVDKLPRLKPFIQGKNPRPTLHF